jgi:hypothetical protein
MEEMNGVIIPPHTRSVKVNIFSFQFPFLGIFFYSRRLSPVHVVKVVYAIQMNMKKCYVYSL